MAKPPESRKGISREIFVGLIVAIVGGLFVWWVTEFLHTKSLESAIDCSSDDFQADGLLMKKGDKYQREGHWKQARQCYEKAAVKWNGMAGTRYLCELDCSAMTKLGIIYDNGYGVTSDYEQARQWYEKALAFADSSIGLYRPDPDALCRLGELYENGHGVTKDDERAHQLYEKAAAAGHPRAMFLMGTLYEEWSPQPDKQKARQWYQKAADAGDELAKNRLRDLDKSNH